MKKHHLKRKIFLAYFLVPLFSLIALSLIILTIYRSESRNRILRSETVSAELMESSFRKDSENLISSAVQYSYTPWVKRLSYLQKLPDRMDKVINASDISDYASMISLTEINDPIIKSIYIYFDKIGFGITDSGRCDWQTYLDINSMTSPSSKYILGDFLHSDNQKTIFHNVTMKKNGIKMEGFIFVQSIPINIRQSGANVVLFVPYDSILHRAGSLTDTDGIGTAVTNGKTLIYSGSNNEIDSKSKIYQGFIDNGQQYKFLKETSQYVYSYNKTGMELGFIKLIDNTYVNRDFYVFAGWMFIMMLIFTGMIILAAWRLASLSYEPLNNIVSKISGEIPDESETGNEYQIIEEELEKLGTVNRALTETIDEQTPVIEEFLIQKLLCAEKPEERDVQFLKSSSPYQTYRILLIKKQNITQQTKQLINNCMMMFPQIHTLPIEYEDSILWYISCPTESIYSDIGENLNEAFVNAGIIGCGVGISASSYDISNLKAAYRQSQTALMYYFFAPDHCIVFYEDWMDQKSQGKNNIISIDPEIIADINEGVHKRNTAAVINLYEIFVAKAISQKANVNSIYDGVRYLNRILDKAVKNIASLDCFIQPIEKTDPNDYNDYHSFLKVLKMRVDNIIRTIDTKASTVKKDTDGHILEFIDTHISDESLSLNYVADVMHYNVTYFGKYFKERFGCLFQQYVSEKRIELAKNLIREGKYSMHEVALKCGFSNDVTFRRTFKAYTQMTPSQYSRVEESCNRQD